MSTPLTNQELAQRFEVLTKLYEILDVKYLNLEIVFQGRVKKTYTKTKLFRLEEIRSQLIDRLDDEQKILKVNLTTSKKKLLGNLFNLSNELKILVENYGKKIEALESKKQKEQILLKKSIANDLDFLDHLFFPNKTPKL